MPPASSSIRAGALYVVATPIGNLADLTLRAIHVLALVDAIACEDTRHSARAAARSSASTKPLLALHAAQRARGRARRCCERLARGERVAYVSDAGTPAISDPGARAGRGGAGRGLPRRCRSRARAARSRR